MIDRKEIMKIDQLSTSEKISNDFAANVGAPIQTHWRQDVSQEGM